MPFSPSTPLSYCTNIHAGIDLDSIRDNLLRHATAVRDRLQTSTGFDSLGVGLWIPDLAAKQLTDGTEKHALIEFREFLAEHQLIAPTINGFPFDNFHGEHVKQHVYLPTWADPSRMQYTLRLAEILSGLLPDGQPIGSISTLPIGWPNNPFAEDDALSNASIIKSAGQQFRKLAVELDRLHQQTGKQILVAIEPEPGCLLDTVDDVVSFFDQELSEPLHRQYITVCHDICHSVVMNESQQSVLSRYTSEGIRIGKIQVSSAIVVDWKTISERDRPNALRQLGDFAEDRYLHQTGQLHSDGRFALAEDLPQLLAETDPGQLSDQERWMVHFHVPIFLESFGLLSTSRDAVLACMAALEEPTTRENFSGHLEVETYAWTVLPQEMRQRGLAEDIASELAWLSDQLSVQVSKNRASL